MRECLDGVFSRLRWGWCEGWNRGGISRSANVCPRRAAGGNESTWGIAPAAESVRDRVLSSQLGDGWDGDGKSFFVLGLLWLLSAKE